MGAGSHCGGTVNNSAILSGVDFLPSVLSLAGAKAFAPTQSDGVDLSATFPGQKPTGRIAPLLWKRPPDRPGVKSAPLPDLAVREGDWKLLIQEDGSRPQLFDLTKDRGETRNLAVSQPQISARLKKIVLDWNRTLPHSKVELDTQQPLTNWTLHSGDHLDKVKAPDIARRGFRVSASFVGDSPHGVLVAQGGVANGYTLFVDEAGRLVFLIRVKSQVTQVASEKLAGGAHTAVAQVAQNGALSLSLDGQLVARDQATSIFSSTPLDGLDVGSDQGGLVGPYANVNAFNGNLKTVEIQLDFDTKPH